MSTSAAMTAMTIHTVLSIGLLFPSWLLPKPLKDLEPGHPA
jgi:hypothetical protein